MKQKKKTFSVSKKYSAKKTPKKQPLLFFGLGMLGISVLSLLGYRYWKTKQQALADGAKQTNPFSKPSSKTKHSARRWKDDSFPLSFSLATNTGSSGPRVLQLQQKLNLKHNAALVADGKFGPLTQTTLLYNGYPTSIELEAFNKIVDSEATLVFDPKRIATLIWTSANAGLLASCLNALSQLKDIADYQSVSTIFKTFRDPSDYFHSHTIVTHLLDFAFKDSDAAKIQLKEAFLRIGLKQKSGQWSLSGISKPKRLITLNDTYVRTTNGKIAQVKSNTLLGTKQKTAQGLIWFKAIDGSTGVVPSQHVRCIN